MTDGAFSRASVNSILTPASVWPFHIESRSETLIEKKQLLTAVATAFASKVLPV